MTVEAGNAGLAVESLARVAGLSPLHWLVVAAAVATVAGATAAVTTSAEAATAEAAVAAVSGTAEKVVAGGT